MSTALKTVFALIIVALVAGAGYCWYGWNQTRLDLQSSQDRIASMEQSLGSYQQELATKLDELAGTTAQLEVAQGRLSSVENELRETVNSLSTVRADLEDTEARLNSIQTDALNLHNPTLREVLDFLKEDKTDAAEYTSGEYVCLHFVRDVKEKAVALGIRCAYVHIRFPVMAHSILAFETVDQGLVYFDAITDERIRPEIGREYWRCVEPKPGIQYKKPDYDDTIEEIIVIW